MAAPTVSIVFLVFNRCAELRTSLRQMLVEADYEPGLLEVVVVDNASTDGSAAMVRDEFPQVRLIERSVNCGVSGWNDGFAVATGDWVLALDDDCYLPGTGLRDAIAAAEDHGADLVSFGVRTPDDEDYRFNEKDRTGLLSFWGCAVLMRRDVLGRLTGYDPEICVWANELEFMMRFFDEGFRHLHLPEVVAVHMKDVSGTWADYIGSRGYRINTRHFAYIAGKLLRPRDALEAFVALLVGCVRDGVRVKREAFTALTDCVAGFANGLRHRAPVRRAEVSTTYRRNFHSFQSPWWISRQPGEIARGAARRVTGRPPLPPSSGRRVEYFAERARYYPDRAETLEI